MHSHNMFAVSSYKMTIGPGRLIPMSHEQGVESSLLASCVHNESRHISAASVTIALSLNIKAVYDLNYRQRVTVKIIIARYDSFNILKFKLKLTKIK